MFNQSRLNAISAAIAENKAEKSLGLNQALVPAMKLPTTFKRIEVGAEYDIPDYRSKVKLVESHQPSEFFWSGVDVGRFMRSNGIRSTDDKGVALEDQCFRFLNASILKKDEYKITLVPEPKSEMNPEGKPSIRVAVATREGIKGTVFLRRNPDMPETFFEGATPLRGQAHLRMRVCIEKLHFGVEVTMQIVGKEDYDNQIVVFSGTPYRIGTEIVLPQIPGGGTFKKFNSVEEYQQWVELWNSPEQYETDGSPVEINELNSDYSIGDNVVTYEVTHMDGNLRIEEYLVQQFVRKEKEELAAALREEFAA